MLEDLTPPTAFRTCKVGTILQTLETKDQAILEAAISSPDWPIKTLSRELRKRGLELSDTPLSNHRSQNCVCFA